MDIKKSKKDKEIFNQITDKLESSDIAGVLKTLIQSKKEYEVTKEQETTKRMKIHNDMIQYLKNLEAKKEFVYKAFQEEYSIRRETIDRMFLMIEECLDEGKNEVVISALNNIEGIVKESPLKSIASIASAFENDDEELII